MLRAMIGALVLLLAPVAHADIDSAQVRAGLVAYQHLHYERAVALLGQALAESLTREEKVATWRTLGLCHVGLDQPDEARRDFERLLTIDPSIELDVRVAPRVRGIFEEARANVAQRRSSQPPAYRVAELTPVIAPAVPRAGHALDVTLVHPGGLAQKAELFYRQAGALDFRRLQSRADDAGVIRLEVPAGDVKAPRLDYYAVVIDEAGAAVARAGTLAAPLTLNVTTGRVPLYRRPWFWGVIGGAAVVVLTGAIVTAAVLNASSTVTLTPR